MKILASQPTMPPMIKLTIKPMVFSS